MAIRARTIADIDRTLYRISRFGSYYDCNVAFGSH